MSKNPSDKNTVHTTGATKDPQLWGSQATDNPIEIKNAQTSTTKHHPQVLPHTVCLFVCPLKLFSLGDDLEISLRQKGASAVANSFYVAPPPNSSRESIYFPQFFSFLYPRGRLLSRLRQGKRPRWLPAERERIKKSSELPLNSTAISDFRNFI